MQAAGAGAGVDRLSILADDVLQHILSFVPGTKRKAQTSILSKRWRNLWAHDPNISILMEQKFFSVYEVEAMEYIGTVDQCLRACRAPALQTLELNLYSPYYRFGLCPFANAASRWIRFAGSRSVRLLRLVGLTPGSHVGGPKLPRSIFNCGQSLCEMDIKLCTFTVAIPSYFQSQAFHRLRKLHLTSTFIADQTLGDFLSKCPALEDLRLLHCQELTQLHLALPNLTKLIVSGCLGLVRAAIDAPKLRYIFFAGNLSRLSLKAPLLHHVGLLNDGDQASFGHWRRLLSAISHAEDLWVNDWLFKFLVEKNHAQDGPDAMFNNLKQLRCDVEWITKPVLHALCSILAESPSLEELYIDLCHGNRGKVRTSLSIPFRYRYPTASGLTQQLYELVQKDFRDDYMNNMLDLPDPLEGYEKPLKCLKTARFLEFIGSVNEFRLVEFILGNSVSLETLTVLNFHRCHEEAYSKVFEEAYSKVFATFRKASQHVQISQSNTDTGNRFYQECKMYILSSV